MPVLPWWLTVFRASTGARLARMEGEIMALPERIEQALNTAVSSATDAISAETAQIGEYVRSLPDTATVDEIADAIDARFADLPSKIAGIFEPVVDAGGETDPGTDPVVDPETGEGTGGEDGGTVPPVTVTV